MRRVKQNAWGNWRGYEGRAFAYDFGTNEQAAQSWAAGGELPKFDREVFRNKIGGASSIKLKKIAGIVQRLARPMMGVGGYVRLGDRCSTLPGDDRRSVNIEDFANHDDTDLFDTRDDWRKLEVADNAVLDFYVYNRDELVDNLGILIRGGEVVAWNLVGDKLDGHHYDAWRPINGGAMQPKSFFTKGQS